MLKYARNTQQNGETSLIGFPTFLKLLLGFFVICSIYGCFDGYFGKKMDINRVQKYCAAEQLKLTGQTKCTKAQRKLSKRYIKTLIRRKKQLASLTSASSELARSKEEKCSPKGLYDYGTQGCSEANRKLQENHERMVALAQKINQKHKEVTDLQVYKLYKVSARSLNVRKCAKTSCEIITQLSSGSEVYAEFAQAAWATVITEKGKGYVVQKYLVPVTDFEIKIN